MKIKLLVDKEFLRGQIIYRDTCIRHFKKLLSWLAKMIVSNYTVAVKGRIPILDRGLDCFGRD